MFLLLSVFIYPLAVAKVWPGPQGSSGFQTSELRTIWGPKEAIGGPKNCRKPASQIISMDVSLFSKTWNMSESKLDTAPFLDDTEHDQSVCVAMGLGPSTYPWLLVGKRKRFTGKCPHLYHVYSFNHLNWWLFHEDKKCRSQICLTGMEASGLPSCPEEWSQNLFETPQAPEDQESMPET